MLSDRSVFRFARMLGLPEIGVAILTGLVFVSVLALAGCSEETDIFVDRSLIENPPDAAQGFLGYNEEAEKLTICGNCHVGQQTRWQTSGHADAWETLQASGHAASYCEGCHTVGPFGNATEGAVGFAGAPDPRYHDVQCESCHGPGLVHVNNPTNMQPLASISIIGTPNQNCAECHTGAHHPFADEWLQSPHAEVVPSVLSRIVEDANYEECLACHSGQGALKAWGVNVNYIERDAAAADQLGITCAVCHDPHGSSNEGQLRFPHNSTNAELNLCIKCHHKRAEPETEAETLRGPHSPEGPLVLGEAAGWLPPNFDATGPSTHGGAENRDLCASCHVVSYSINDPATGGFLFQATGHLFQAIPCTDENGIPIPDGDCEIEDRNLQGCMVSGCHPSGDPGALIGAYRRTTERVWNLVADVDALLELTPEGALDRNDGIFTVADGAWFNARLGELPGSPIHNPDYMRRLLSATITALEDEYGLAGAVVYQGFESE